MKVEWGPICAVMRCQCCGMIEEQQGCDRNSRAEDARGHIIKTDNMSLCTRPKKTPGGGAGRRILIPETPPKSASELSQRRESPAKNSGGYTIEKLQTLNLKSANITNLQRNANISSLETQIIPGKSITQKFKTNQPRAKVHRFRLVCRS